jgi:hypothetical protein
MSTATDNTAHAFLDRRSQTQSAALPARERRQFSNSHAELSPEARELAAAIDQYKIQHRRRFIDYEEMLMVIQSLGYRKAPG